MPVALLSLALACAPEDTDKPGPSSDTADVIGVDVSGDPGARTLSVTIRSPDTGCDLYADWWEVVSADGALLYRRILAHSHVDEQPFSRSGGPVAVADDEIVVRAHLNTGGYGDALRGTPSGGLSAWTVPDGWAAELESADPQPDGCAF